MTPGDPDDDPRFAIVALVPLAVIVLGAFVPPILLWHPWQPPEALFVDTSVFWTVPAGAAVLAIVAIRCRWRSAAPAGAAITLAVVVVAVVAVAVPTLALVECFPLSAESTILGALAAAMIATLGAAVGFLVIARRARGWRRWIAILGAYAVVALPYGCRMVAALPNEWSGGVTFVVAEAALLALVVRALWPR